MASNACVYTNLTNREISGIRKSPCCLLGKLSPPPRLIERFPFGCALRCSAIFPVDALLSAAVPRHPCAGASRRWPYKSGAASLRHALWKALHNRVSSAQADRTAQILCRTAQDATLKAGEVSLGHKITDSRNSTNGVASADISACPSAA